VTLKLLTAKIYIGNHLLRGHKMGICPYLSLIPHISRDWHFFGIIGIHDQLLAQRLLAVITVGPFWS
jgi:hypothetical protein